MCTQAQEKSAVKRVNLQHGIVLPAKISNAATALFNQLVHFLISFGAFSASLNG